jgi:hypothetical protein
MDVIDTAQRRQLEEIEHALAERKPAGPGREHCANLDCAAPIALVRQQLGAVLCIDCQRDAEQEAQRCARGAA